MRPFTMSGQMQYAAWQLDEACTLYCKPGGVHRTRSLSLGSAAGVRLTDLKHALVGIKGSSQEPDNLAAAAGSQHTVTMRGWCPSCCDMERDTTGKQPEP